MSNRAERRAKDYKPKIVLAFPHPGMVATDFMVSVLQLVYSGKYHLKIVEGHSGPVISKVRNTLVEHFLRNEPEAEYLLFADTDMVFNDEVLDRLLKADLPIASALYVAPYPRPDELNPVALNREDDGKFWPLQINDSDGFDPEQPIRCDGVGMGLCLIKRRVLEDLGANADTGQPFAEMTFEGMMIGEDLAFCLRAEVAGYESYVIPAARAGHRKTFTV